MGAMLLETALRSCIVFILENVSFPYILSLLRAEGGLQRSNVQ